MDFNYQNVLNEDRQRSTKIIIGWFNMLSGLIFLIWALDIFNIFPVSNGDNIFIMPLSAVILLIPQFVSVVFLLLKKTPPSEPFAYFTLICGVLSISLLSVSLPRFGVVAWFFPVLIACQYSSKKMTLVAYLIGVIGLLFTQRQSEPSILLYVISLPLIYSISKRSELLLKKQRLLMMARQAKKSFDELSEFPDTFETDCRIKARYLAKNGINIDKALEAMDNNIEKYNDFVLTFIGESQRKADELLSLLNPDTLVTYGTKVHSLRIKANALGLSKLTDTAFFHEMEAFAGNFDIVALNFEKLDAEWSEVYEILTTYINSVGLKNHAYDNTGNQISFQEWGEQLQEAFDALDAYDTIKAKEILNHLLQYQIDKDINQKLANIISNIDDILKA